MIELARDEGERGTDTAPAAFLVGDMLALPFAARSFDIVTTGYGLRNVPDLATAIDEIGRVLTPGGQVLSLDFNRPANAHRSLRLSGLPDASSARRSDGSLHRDPDTYRYIPASIRQYPGAAAVGADVRGARLHAACACYPVLGGLMAIHHAIRDLIRRRGRARGRSRSS